MIAGSQSSPVPSPRRVEEIWERAGRENSNDSPNAATAFETFIGVASMWRQQLSEKRMRAGRDSLPRKLFIWALGMRNGRIAALSTTENGGIVQRNGCDSWFFWWSEQKMGYQKRKTGRQGCLPVAVEYFQESVFADFRPGRSDPDSLPCSRRRRSPSQMLPSSRYSHRLLLGPGVGSASRRGDRRVCRSTSGCPTSGRGLRTGLGKRHRR